MQVGLILVALVLLPVPAVHADATATSCGECSVQNGAAKCTPNGCLITCQQGYALLTGKCIRGCPPGRQLKTGKCMTCPANTYKAKIGTSQCTRCPPGKYTAGQQPDNRNSANDCIAGGMLAKDAPTQGTVLLDKLAAFEGMLNFSRTFTGKGGGRRRRGCMLNCGADEKAVDAAEAYLAGSPSEYRSDQPWMGLPSRMPSPQPQIRCATVVSSAMASVLEASLASLQGVEASSISLSPDFSYFCSAFGDRSC